MLVELEKIKTSGLTELAQISSADDLERWRVAYLGSKGRLKSAMGMMKDVPKADKPKFGHMANGVKQALESAFEEKQASGVRTHAARAIDMTEPGLVESHAIGRQHIITRVRDELVDVFGRMGFDVATGPELEDDEHNFVKLNIPPEHPARDPIDNFYVDNPATTERPRMLRTQTSTVQIRTMLDAAKKGWGPPIKIVSPGRVYRPDTVDATHSFMFHQIEGLYIDHGVSMIDLKSTLMQFARAFFSEDAEVRLRPSFFPFTEPSAEFDMRIALKPGEPAKWIELGGCGMVDPSVLEACWIDADEWTGFAFGFGIERIAMGKYGVPDIRMLYENDLRFLEQI